MRWARAINSGREARPQSRVRRQRRARLAANPLPQPAQSAKTLSRELPRSDRCDVEEPAREHGFLRQSVRAPGQNKKHRARDLRGLSPIARLPQRRGINEPQIAFD